MAGLVLLAILLGRMQNSARNAGRSDFVTAGVRAVVSPLATAFDRGWTGAGDFFAGVFGASRLTESNRRLQSVAQAAQLYDRQVEFYQAEIDRLRKFVGMPPVAGRERVPAQVIAYFPFESRITLGAGTAAGVKPGMPVVTPLGLVGVIQTADVNKSQALLITSPRVTVGAIAQRNPPPAGLLRGDSPGVLILEFLDFNQTVQVGDTVVTSGYSERIPAGIPIGKIVQIQDDREYGSRRCLVFPNVQVGAVREVFILK